jgi:type II secretory pathway component PulF
MSFIVTPSQLNRRAELYHQLGSTIAAGIPLIKALEMASVNAAIRSSRKTILGLVQNLQAGLTFSESMVRVQGWLPDFDIALLSAGEESGRLDASFKQLAVYYAARVAIIRDTIAGLIVTIATLHVFLLIFPLGLFVAFAQGIFYNSYSQCLSFLIEKIVVFGSLYGCVIFLIYACQGKRGKRWRAIVESIAQMIPLLRTAQKDLALSRLAAALEALIISGVPIIKSWKLAAAASGSPRLTCTISEWDSQLESGATPAELINSSRYFTVMFANLYSTAEVSGKLDEALGRLRAYYQEEGFRMLRVFTRIMNGTIYGLVAVMVAFNVIRFYASYFNQAVNSGF